MGELLYRTISWNSDTSDFTILLH